MSETRRLYPRLDGRWSAPRLAAFAEELEADIEPVHVRDVEFCCNCAQDLDGPVYSAWHDGAMRYAFLCGKCAAEFVRLGGRVVLRWVR